MKKTKKKKKMMMMMRMSSMMLPVQWPFTSLNRVYPAASKDEMVGDDGASVLSPEKAVKML